METLFYSMLVFLIGMEIKVLLAPRMQMETAKTLNEEFDKEKEEQDLTKFTSKEGLFMLGEFFYLVILIIGIIFTPERWLFLLIVLMSFIPKAKIGLWYVVVDAILSIAILVMIMLNHFIIF